MPRITSTLKMQVSKGLNDLQLHGPCTKLMTKPRLHTYVFRSGLEGNKAHGESSGQSSLQSKHMIYFEHPHPRAVIAQKM